jgi:hypothetical protein
LKVAGAKLAFAELRLRDRIVLLDGLLAQLPPIKCAGP